MGFFDDNRTWKEIAERWEKIALDVHNFNIELHKENDKLRADYIDLLNRCAKLSDENTKQYTEILELKQKLKAIGGGKDVHD